jgi:NitT/TauT family transport system substrate-binding protein
MTPISRRRLLASATATAAVGAFGSPRAHAQTAVKVGTAVLADYALAGPFILALERGMFRAEGLNAEFVTFSGGPDLVDAVTAGDVLVGGTGATDVLVSRAAGRPVRMVATQTEGNHFTLNVAPTITNVAQLKGQAIGVTRVGATTWVFARILARQQRWDTDGDVKIVALGGLDAQLEALAQNRIAAFVWGDGGAVAQLQGKSKLLMRLDTVTPKWISQILCASENAVRKRNETIRRALRAVFNAQRFMSQKPGDAAEAIAKTIGWGPDAVLAAHGISGGLISHDGTISLQALASMQDVLLKHGVLEKKLPVEEHVTREFTPVRFS